MTANRISLATLLVILTATFSTSAAAYGQEGASSTMATTQVDASAANRSEAVTEAQRKSATSTPSPASSSQPAIAPMTAKEKLQYGVYETFLTPGAYLGPAISAYVVERRDVKALGKKNNDKFADGLSRFGRAFATHASGEFLGSGLYPALFKQNPVYQRSGKQGFMPRAAYALSRAFVTTGDNGKTQPNFSRILGNLTSASMANLYERDSVRHRDRFGRVSEFNRRVGVGPTLRTFGASMAVGALSHVLFDEFDVVKKLLKVP
jgi:hypothetical protein